MKYGSKSKMFLAFCLISCLSLASSQSCSFGSGFCADDNHVAVCTGVEYAYRPCPQGNICAYANDVPVCIPVASGPKFNLRQNNNGGSSATTTTSSTPQQQQTTTSTTTTSQPNNDPTTQAVQTSTSTTSTKGPETSTSLEEKSSSTTKPETSTSPQEENSSNPSENAQTSATSSLSSESSSTSTESSVSAIPTNLCPPDYPSTCKPNNMIEFCQDGVIVTNTCPGGSTCFNNINNDSAACITPDQQCGNEGFNRCEPGNPSNYDICRNGAWVFSGTCASNGVCAADGDSKVICVDPNATSLSSKPTTALLSIPSIGVYTPKGGSPSLRPLLYSPFALIAVLFIQAL
ncbi:hypothetical protein AYI68_g6193 [Smittium mucronatum]|uniref:Uncharacterized protein n=1 Tax=Smittium mucronatum TaxID=133383 RepID=A0A1R0GS47_9FUNG|nr:hypothetical protein AYI68_g6193 [Smittium mucronatum]